MQEETSIIAHCGCVGRENVVYPSMLDDEASGCLTCGCAYKAVA